MNEKVVELHEWWIGIEMRGGGDVRRLYGRIENHPRIYNDSNMNIPSTFVSFDENKMIAKSYSGTIYHLSDYRWGSNNPNYKTEKEAIEWIKEYWVASKEEIEISLNR